MMLDMIKKAVFFGAHTDDEMIAAGTLHRLVRKGAAVKVVAFSTAAVKEDRKGGSHSFAVVEDEWRSSMKLIGAGGYVFRTFFPSAELEKFRQEIADEAFTFCETWKPDAAFILSPDDENPAHAVVGRQCERVMRGRVPLVIRCNFPWNYSMGRSNLFVRLDESDLECKRAVIRAYESQKWRYRYEEMLISYAIADGLSVKVTPAAEKFEIIREVV